MTAKIRKRNKMLIGKLKNIKAPTKQISKNKLKNQLSMLERNVQEEFKNDNKDRYKLILDQQALYNYLNGDEIFGLDTESDILGNDLDPMDDTFVGMSLYSPVCKNAIYVPVNHKKTHLVNFNYTTDYRKQLTPEQIKEVFQEIKNVKFVLHNAPYDTRVFLNGVNYFNTNTILWDTYLASMYLNENEPHNLKYLYDKYIQGLDEKESSSFKELFKDIPFSIVPLYLARLYAGKDPVMTYELYNFQKDYLKPDGKFIKNTELKKAGQFFIDVEMPMVKTVVEMEERGVNLDTEYAKKLSTEYHEKRKNIEKIIHKFLDTLDYNNLTDEKKSKLDNPINLNSPTQLSIIIFDVMQLKANKKSTDEETLKYLRDNNSGKVKQLFEKLLEHRSIEKLIGTYIDKLPKVVKKDGKIHANFNQYGAKTGRFSSNNPNLQNIPKKNKDIRQMFTASEGKILLCSDYS